jgi:hypothetical protein
MCAYYIRYVCQLSNVGEGHNFGIHVHSFFFLFWVGLENNFVSFQNAIFCSNMLLIFYLSKYNFQVYLNHGILKRGIGILQIQNL